MGGLAFEFAPIGSRSVRCDNHFAFLGRVLCASLWLGGGSSSLPLFPSGAVVALMSPGTCFSVPFAGHGLRTHTVFVIDCQLRHGDAVGLGVHGAGPYTVGCATEKSRQPATTLPLWVRRRVRHLFAIGTTKLEHRSAMGSPSHFWAPHTPAHCALGAPPYSSRLTTDWV